jgi:hypothetical protein
LAGSLKRELNSKYGISPKIHFAHGELEVLVNQNSVFSFKRENRTPTVEGLLKLIEEATQGKPSSAV